MKQTNRETIYKAVGILEVVVTTDFNTVDSLVTDLQTVCKLQKGGYMSNGESITKLLEITGKLDTRLKLMNNVDNVRADLQGVIFTERSV